jgi:hypothetical protein
MATADDFYDWHEDFVINGNNKPEHEKLGSIIMTNSARNKDLLTVSLNALGIVNIVAEKADVTHDAIRRVKVEMYCEEMSFEYL